MAHNHQIIMLCLEQEDYNLDRKISFPEEKKCQIYYHPSKPTSLYWPSVSAIVQKQAQFNLHSEAKELQLPLF